MGCAVSTVLPCPGRTLLLPSLPQSQAGAVPSPAGSVSSRGHLADPASNLGLEDIIREGVWGALMSQSGGSRGGHAPSRWQWGLGASTSVVTSV